MIEQVTAFGDACLEKYGSRLFYCSDEFYVRAGIPLPPEEFYEDYSQIENGVGMLTSLASEFDFALEDLEAELKHFQGPRTVSVVTGVAAYDHICGLADRLMSCVHGLDIRVHRIVNHFFGESVTVAGLLTGADVSRQLAGKDLGDELLFPAVMLRADGDVFLDDMTPQELSQRLGVPTRPSKSDGFELVKALLGLD